MRSYGTRNGYGSHCRGQCRELSSSKSNAQSLKRYLQLPLKTLLLRIRCQELSRDVRTSQEDKDMQWCKGVETMMRSEVVGRHETAEQRRVLFARQLSIWGICHGQHVAYEERPNPAAEPMGYWDTVLSPTESQCK